MLTAAWNIEASIHCTYCILSKNKVANASNWIS